MVVLTLHARLLATAVASLTEGMAVTAAKRDAETADRRHSIPADLVNVVLSISLVNANCSLQANFKRVRVKTDGNKGGGYISMCVCNHYVTHSPTIFPLDFQYLLWM